MATRTLCRRSRQHRSRFLVGLLLASVVALALSACASSDDRTEDVGSSENTTQTNEGGQVTIKATWRGRGPDLVFTIAMDTHTVDLDGIDLSTQAVLRVDGGAEQRPVAWEAPTGGHHREGTLRFAEVSDGVALIGPNTRSIELVIRDVAGVKERIFQWSL